MKHLLPCLLVCAFCSNLPGEESFWPPLTAESKPGAYWWWHGSAVDAEGLRWNVERAAGNNMGALHIIPIYGVRGNEANDIPFMSEKWLAMMHAAVEEGKKNGLNIDMTLGTGWCFGGPDVADEDSATWASFKPGGNDRIDLSLARKACKVKRSAPGGEGPMLDPFSLRAIDRYLAWFDKRLENDKGPMPRAVYHDSYEYRANWSDELYDAFESRCGYRLQDHLDVFVFKGGNDDPGADRVRRIKADYRRTLAEMHLAFTNRWTDWARKRGFLTRNEAHGSPSNWLDVYAAADIPETEFFRNDKNPLVAKFSSSAAHVSGRNLVGSESGTWADEHYHEKLGTLKVLFDGFFLSGVNHLYYHGTIYSPEDAPWPGRAFYASTQMNPRNTIWRDAFFLNAYISRVQSVLQAGKPDNDILLLWTPEEAWHRPGGDVINFSVHNSWDWFNNSATGILARKLWDNGFSFDYVSPLQLSSLKVENGRIVAPGGDYKILLVPKLSYLDTEAFATLVDLSDKGAEVCFDAEYPKDVPGFARLEERRKEFAALKDKAPEPIPPALFDYLSKKLNRPPSKKTPYLGSTGLKSISRRIDGGRYVFVANVAPQFDYRPKNPVPAIAGDFRLEYPAEEILLLDPMTGKTGKAAWRLDKESGLPEVRLVLRPNQSLILRTFDRKPDAEIADWSYPGGHGSRRIGFDAPWKIEFVSGGPTLPKTLRTDELKSWHQFGTEYENFSGTAKYETTFDVGKKTVSNFSRLNLGAVCESARVKLNGKDLGCVFCEPMIVEIPPGLLKAAANVLEIEVTNLAANRIRYTDREGLPWKIFKDINIVDIDYRAMDASKWPVQPGGLLGPVVLEE